jgi:hypothetical protein
MNAPELPAKEVDESFGRIDSGDLRCSVDCVLDNITLPARTCEFLAKCQQAVK